MAITMNSLQSTQNVRTDGIKIVVYGPSGAGKTKLIATAPDPIILSAESGLLSLRTFNLPYIEIKTLKDLEEAYVWTQTEEARTNFKTICLDSLSEIGESVLENEKKNTSHAMKAYGEMKDKMNTLVKNFRDLKGWNVYFSAKQEQIKDGLTGAISHGPMMPGAKLAQELPYLFDEVFQLHVHTDEAGVKHRFLRTDKDPQYEAKDRSGALEYWEQPNLTDIFNKITNS